MFQGSLNILEKVFSDGDAAPYSSPGPGENDGEQACHYLYSIKSPPILVRFYRGELTVAKRVEPGRRHQSTPSCALFTAGSITIGYPYLNPWERRVYTLIYVKRQEFIAVVYKHTLLRKCVLERFERTD